MINIGNFDVIDFPDIYDDQSSKVTEYLQFNIDPLALVIAMLEGGYDRWRIGQTIESLGLASHISAVETVSREHQKKAKEIYSYFSKKYTLRRLKNEHISKYMTAVEELCENHTRINKEYIGILVTLPTFFEENRELEDLMKTFKSLDLENSPKNQNISIDETVEFVKSICLRRKKGFNTHYFWKRPDGTLLRTVSKTHDLDNSAWECLSRVGKIKIVSNDNWVSRIKGYEFNVLEMRKPAVISVVS